MKEQYSAELEREISEQYNRGRIPERGSPEEAIYQAYRAIGNTLRGIPVQTIDRSTLIERMMAESHTSSQTTPIRSLRSAWSWNRRIPFLVYAAAGIVLLGVCLPMAWSLLGGPDTNPVRSYTLSEPSIQVPWLWEYRLQCGTLVHVPHGTSITFQTADGSTVEAASGSRLAFDFRHERNVELKTGSLHIKAASDPQKKMHVITPLGTVTVIGTEFTVKLIESN